MSEANSVGKIATYAAINTTIVIAVLRPPILEQTHRASPEETQMIAEAFKLVNHLRRMLPSASSGVIDWPFAARADLSARFVMVGVWC